MRRGDLLAGLLAATGASALRAAEPNRVYRLDLHRGEWLLFQMRFGRSFFDRLRQFGYVEGKNLVVYRYAADGRAELYVDIARDVARSKPDVIAIPNSHQLTLQLAKEASAIPIVALMGDPVAAGRVQNIARPSGNITGIASHAGIGMQGKDLDILRQAIPSASRIAYLSPRADGKGACGRAIVDAGRRSGVSIIGMPVEYSADQPQYRDNGLGPVTK
jgi:putative ABC transport system substrate-binding protein